MQTAISYPVTAVSLTLAVTQKTHKNKIVSNLLQPNAAANTRD